ncbi:hypothetical protein FGADI_12252 [Fusarium gaditjirri]|uniref:Uncharacterized protein n=1 Tax=Fusarium gaditjirri TaxID=282569 RepID=A0A8H4SST0_9HYPO|nr:hypothetical protein FGADI_12252 [Fusarium gaditjirri]
MKLTKEGNTAPTAFKLHLIGFLSLPQQGRMKPIPDVFPLVAHFAFADVFTDGSKACDCDEDDNSWEPLSTKDVHLLEELYAHQICAWKNDEAYLSDSFVVKLRHNLDRAYTKLNAARSHHVEDTAFAASSANEGAVTDRDLAVENLRVQVDISNSLRGIWEALHLRNAKLYYFMNDEVELELERGYQRIPPRVGPNTLPQRFRGPNLATSVDEGPSNDPKAKKTGGRKRAASEGGGQAATGGKKPRTK